MKKTSTLTALAIAACLLSVTTGVAQGDGFFAASGKAIPVVPVLVKSINARAVQHLKKEYATVTNATWYEIPGGIVSKFEKDGISYRLGFHRNGNEINTLRTYHEAQLPVAIRQLVKSNYYDLGIQLVEEISAAGELAYIIHLEDSKELKKIKIQNEEIFILEALKK